MTSKPPFVLGFDPGGIRQFGWCLAEATDRPRLIHSGIANNADEAVDSVCADIDDSVQLLAAGIDSPLFWIGNGDRQVDQTVRAKMRAKGAPNVWGTVQSVNSLRGACLIQGILTARLLRSRFPNIRITESHPKALLWLMGVANNERRAREVGMGQLSKLIDCDLPEMSEHERDAALGAVAALKMLRKADGWRDLALDERNAFFPVKSVEYWMPIDDACAETGSA
jgi:hypothetical protein